MVEQGCELFPSFRAASRTRSSPLGPLSQLCVWHGLGCGVFSLVSGLPSTASSDGRPPLFGCFVGTMPLYDSPCAQAGVNEDAVVKGIIQIEIRLTPCTRKGTVRKVTLN